MGEFVTHEVDGDVGTVTIDRPERLNALATPVLEGLDAAFEQFEAADVSAAVVRTAGDRAFVAGADLKEMVDLSLDEFETYIELQGRVNDAIETHPAAVIAEVDALAFGGGFELALSADMIVAAEGAEFGFPEITLGMIPGGGGTQRLARIVGPNKAKELVTTGEPIPAAEAERLGIVNRVAPPGELADATGELVDAIVTKGSLAVRQATRVIDKGADASLPTALEYERQAVLRLRESEDAHEGVRAFLEDREPEFRGR